MQQTKIPRKVSTRDFLACLCLVAVLWPSYAFSANCITGRVVDETNQQPIASASVSVKNTAQAVTTDSKGSFSLCPATSVAAIRKAANPNQERLIQIYSINGASTGAAVPLAKAAAFMRAYAGGVYIARIRDADLVRQSKILMDGSSKARLPLSPLPGNARGLGRALAAVTLVASQLGYTDTEVNADFGDTGVVISLQPQSQSDAMPDGLPDIAWHLTGRPWQPFNTPASEYLDRLENWARFLARNQDGTGAIKDPVDGGTDVVAAPALATCVGSLMHAGRGSDLVKAGAAAEDRATSDQNNGLYDGAAEFSLAPAALGYKYLSPYVAASTASTWLGRMKRPIASMISSNLNNWRANAMKGQWLRAVIGAVSHSDAVSFIENGWTGSQRAAMAKDRWNLYQDGPDAPSLAVEVNGRGNLVAMMSAGYDGASAGDMWSILNRATKTSLLAMDPTGGCPAGGRCDDHVWNDVYYQLAFEHMSERALAAGQSRLAGQYRRAALLTFKGLARWARTDGSLAGSFYVTKNHFDPKLRVGVQEGSNFIGFSSLVALYTSEAYFAHQAANVAEQPAPVEIGGYAFATDAYTFSAFANAGGMQLEANLRGETAPVKNRYWYALGVVRFSRAGWDSRIGPGDGIYNGSSGVTFAPTFEENGNWVRLAGVPGRYQGTFSASFTHPLLVRCAIEYRPKSGQSGPVFRDDFVITPDGVLSITTRKSGSGNWGMTVPLLQNDGAALDTSMSGRIIRTAYSGSQNEQNFICASTSASVAASATVQGTYGYLAPVRVTTADDRNYIFVYPRSEGDPAAAEVRDDLKVTGADFSTTVCRVQGSLYVGRYAAGGVGSSIDINNDGTAEVTFTGNCGFICQLSNGRITSIEADRAVSATVNGSTYALTAYAPIAVGP